MSFTWNDGVPHPPHRADCFPGALSQVPTELMGPIKPCARSLCLCFVLHAPRTPNTLLQACGTLGLLPNWDPSTKFTFNVHKQ